VSKEGLALSYAPEDVKLAIKELARDAEPFITRRPP
jgi:hypothetical protein